VGWKEGKFVVSKDKDLVHYPVRRNLKTNIAMLLLLLHNPCVVGGVV